MTKSLVEADITIFPLTLKFVRKYERTRTVRTDPVDRVTETFLAGAQITVLERFTSLAGVRYRTHEGFTFDRNELRTLIEGGFVQPVST